MDFSAFFNFIFESIGEFLLNILQFAFGWINLPDMPVEITSSINSFLDLIFNNLSLLGIFIRPITLMIVVPLILILINFEMVYKIIIWIVRKIPFLNVR